MSIWKGLLRQLGVGGGKRPVTRPAPVAQPGEPEVFECRACGKVFEVTRNPVLCPECDSADVEFLG